MSHGENSLRRNFFWGVVAFGVVLAVVIGIRLDQAALAAVVGVVCGVGGSIPTSLLIVSLLRRRDAREREQKAGQRRMAQSPPVVVVAPSAVPQLGRSNLRPEDYVLSQPAQRQFSVIGEEEAQDSW